MSQIKQNLIVVVISFVGIVFFVSNYFKKNTETTTYIEKNFSAKSLQLKVDFPKDRFDFCGERMPANQSSNYKKFNKELRKFLAYRNGLKQLFRRADYYFPSIEKRLSRCNLPEDMKYIPMIESRFLKGKSEKGAQGFWQFMPATAQNYGLVVNDSLDERLDLKKSTQAACSYLNQMNKSLNSWTLTAAAFNSGLGRVDSKMTNNPVLYSNFYTASWNEETYTYIFRLMAIKHIYENRDRYNL